MNRKEQFKKIYVDVNLDSDAAGFIHPRSIRIENGKTYIIDSVKEFHKADPKKKQKADCYSIIIGGKEKHLFFEKTGELFSNSLGRWFVAVRETM